jgi:hypothetical protein
MLFFTLVIYNDAWRCANSLACCVELDLEYFRLSYGGGVPILLHVVWSWT